MAITYSYPGNSPRDAVRFLVGDTSTSTGRLQDAEIDWLVTTWGNTYRAAAEACRVLASRFTSQADTKRVGSLSITRSGQQARWLDLAKAYEAKARQGLTFGIEPYSGGISKSDKELTEADADWDRPWFKIGMHDHPGTDTRTSSILSTST